MHLCQLRLRLSGVCAVDVRAENCGDSALRSDDGLDKWLSFQERHLNTQRDAPASAVRAADRLPVYILYKVANQQQHLKLNTATAERLAAGAAEVAEARERMQVREGGGGTA